MGERMRLITRQWMNRHCAPSYTTWKVREISQKGHTVKVRAVPPTPAITSVKPVTRNSFIRTAYEDELEREEKLLGKKTAVVSELWVWTWPVFHTFIWIIKLHDPAIKCQKQRDKVPHDNDNSQRLSPPYDDVPCPEGLLTCMSPALIMDCDVAFNLKKDSVCSTFFKHKVIVMRVFISVCIPRDTGDSLSVWRSPSWVMETVVNRQIGRAPTWNRSCQVVDITSQAGSYELHWAFGNH